MYICIYVCICIYIYIINIDIKKYRYIRGWESLASHGPLDISLS